MHNNTFESLFEQIDREIDQLDIEVEGITSEVIAAAASIDASTSWTGRKFAKRTWRRRLAKLDRMLDARASMASVKDVFRGSRYLQEVGPAPEPAIALAAA